MLFKAVRELILNVIKHSQSETAVVSIWRENARVKVQVQDKGVGFDVSRLSSTPRGIKGFGLFSIQDRLDFLGCSIEIESTPGIGTVATLVAPLAIESRGAVAGAP